jgi:hypothetical protein
MWTAGIEFARVWFRERGRFWLAVFLVAVFATATFPLLFLAVVTTLLVTGTWMGIIGISFRKAAGELFVISG